MLAIKSVSLSCIFRKLSIFTCFLLLAGLGESCFPTAANAQRIVEEHLIQAKSDLGSSQKVDRVTDSNAETIVASESPEPESLESKTVESNTNEPDTNVHEASTQETNDLEADSESVSSDLEQKIIAELNRVRTNPQNYAEWLESQRQHFQGMILTLPGEQSLRTNRGLRALNEAIAFVRNQQPLPALTDDADLLINAQEQVEAILNQQKLDHHTNNLVYNRVTPEAIVMQLVVDDGFPDRRHRLAVFQEDYQHTGIVCQEIEIYQQVCAIAYENKPLEIIQDSDVQVATNQSSPAQSTSTKSPSDELPKSDSSVNSEIASNSQPSSAPEKIIDTKSPETDNSSSSSLPAPPPAPTEVVRNENQENASQDASPQTEVAEKVNSQTPAETKPESNSESVADPAIATNPATPQEAILPPVPNEETSQEEPPNGNEQVTTSAESASENSSESTSESTTASTQAEPETTAIETEPETTAIETEPETTAIETETTEETQPETEVVAAANTVKPAQVAEIIESGVLEEGDEIVPNDGSFYDSYPLEGSAGDKFSISLESQDFDTFLAVMDPDGNIIEKNDDINEQSSNSRLEITLPDNRSYSVIVNAYDQGGKGKYTLKVTE